MKKIITLLLFLLSTNIFAQVVMDPNRKAKLYFTEAEKRFNQNDYKTALEYIEKAENELGGSNGRILNLKVKTLYNYGKFDQAQKHLAEFVNYYSETVTPQMRAETEDYVLKLERYFEKKQEEERRREEARKRREEEERRREEARREAIKHYKYVSCPNSSCSYGKITEYYQETCSKCYGKGQVENVAANIISGFSQGLENYNTGQNKQAEVYYKSCSRCGGDGKVKKSKKLKCSTCQGEDKVLKYFGSYYLSSDQRQYDIKHKRKKIDYYINIRSEIAKKKSQKLFPAKGFSSGKYGFYDRDLNLVIPHKYEKAEMISDDVALITANSKSGLINSNNKIILPLEYAEIRKLSVSSLLVKKSNTWYLTDYKGNPKGGKVDSFFAYGDYLMVFKQGGKFGIMDFNAQVIEAPTYTDAKVINWNPFLVAFKTNRGWKLKTLLLTARDLYQETFTQIETYSSGEKKVLLLKGQTSKLAKVNGSLISKEGFSETEYYKDLGMFKLKQGTRYGLYDTAQESYVSPSYSDLYLNKDNPHRALVKKYNLYGVIDSRGRTIIPISKPRVWFASGQNKFIVQEKEKSKKRFVYDTNGNILYNYKDN